MKTGIGWTRTSLFALTVAILANPAVATAADEQNAVVAAEQNEGAASAGLGDIVVTAQRRAESLQSVPVAVTAVSQEALVNSGVSDSLEIAKLVPSMKIKTFGGRPNIFIRGVGLNDFSFNSVSPIAIYRDEAVVTSPGAGSFPLFDLAQIEVLRGPQGTLFGKSTTGGAIQFNSRLPENSFEGYLRADYGRYNLIQLEGGMTVPVSDTLSVRLSAFSENRDGDNVNLYDGKDAGALDRQALRVIARFRPTSEFETILIAGVGRDKGDYRAAKPLGLLAGGVNSLGYTDPAPNNPHILNYNFPMFKDVKDKYVTLKISYDIGDITFKSITNYDKSNILMQCDCDATPANLDRHQTGPLSAQEFSQELQASYDSRNGLKALLGLYYNENKWHDRTTIVLFDDIPAFTLPVQWDIRPKTDTLAVFGQASYEVLPSLTLTGGARYTWDKYRGTHRADIVSNAMTPQQAPVSNLLPEISGTAKYDYFSWRLAADYQVNRDILLYASASRGYKSGLYSFNVVWDAGARNKVRPESLTSFEVGVKASLLDNRVRLNLAAFSYDYKDLQVVSVSPTPPGMPPFTALQNAASARIKGIDAELAIAPIDSLRITSNFGILDAHYKDFPNGGIDPSGGLISYSGNRLPNAAKFTNTTSVSFEPPLTDNINGLLYGEYAYSGKVYYNSAEDPLVSSLKGYGVTNIRAGLRDADGKWELAGWVRNLFNKKYIYESTDWSFEGEIAYYYGELRTYGISLRHKF